MLKVPMIARDSNRPVRVQRIVTDIRINANGSDDAIQPAIILRRALTPKLMHPNNR